MLCYAFKQINKYLYIYINLFIYTYIYIHMYLYILGPKLGSSPQGHPDPWRTGLSNFLPEVFRDVGAKPALTGESFGPVVLCTSWGSWVRAHEGKIQGYRYQPWQHADGSYSCVSAKELKPRYHSQYGDIVNL